MFISVLSFAFTKILYFYNPAFTNACFLFHDVIDIEQAEMEGVKQGLKPSQLRKKVQKLKKGECGFCVVSIDKDCLTGLHH